MIQNRRLFTARLFSLLTAAALLVPARAFAGGYSGRSVRLPAAFRVNIPVPVHPAILMSFNLKSGKDCPGMEERIERQINPPEPSKPEPEPEPKWDDPTEIRPHGMKGQDGVRFPSPNPTHRPTSFVEMKSKGKGKGKMPPAKSPDSWDDTDNNRSDDGPDSTVDPDSGGRGGNGGATGPDGETHDRSVDFSSNFKKAEDLSFNASGAFERVMGTPANRWLH
ncbi:MAG: hypothetical protein A3G41_02450 [Elusimicrobia bacterium RIFCSPLOWO2_12_FULL_59_9]|nr:MAG: hypothetical protein A3G41_02450 [Elusimicrobia bacterium RIFCSPLOWO2_12_FULL_59_9]